MATYAASATGQYRIADDSLSGYLLYRGVDAQPNLAGAAWETFTTLPHESAALDVSHVYYFILRLRNAYGLLSQNTESWSVSVGADGNEVVTPPSAPQEISVTPAPNGAVTVSASYFYIEDAELDRATLFVVYLTSDGVDPNPATDTPEEVSFSLADGVGKLEWTSATFADNTTIKVLVRMRRVDGETDVDSTNTDIYSATTETDGPALPEMADEWIIEEPGSFTTIWQHDANTRIDWIQNPGVLRFYIGGTLVAGIGACRRLYLKGVAQENPYTVDAPLAANITYSGGNLCFGVGETSCVKIMEITSDGNLRVAQWREDDGNYPLALAGIAQAIEYHAAQSALDFAPDLLKVAMRLTQTENGGVHNGLITLKGIRENAL